MEKFMKEILKMEFRMEKAIKNMKTVVNMKANLKTGKKMASE